MISLVPAGVSSDVLLRRPDIQEAEHNLKSANADIGAARANFFPTISLTASAGVGSDALSSLFSHGMQIWSFAPSVTLPLFTGGSNLAQLRYAEAQKRGLIATYEKTFRAHLKMSLTHWRGGPRLKSNWMHSASMLKLSNKRSMLACVAIRRVLVIT